MARASAKVILFGEHAVVHGRVAVAAALDRGARASASFDAARSVLELSPWGRTSYADDADDEVGRAFAAVLEASGVRRPARVTAGIDVPGGAGLGGSAAQRQCEAMPPNDSRAVQSGLQRGMRGRIIMAGPNSRGLKAPHG